MAKKRKKIDGFGYLLSEGEKVIGLLIESKTKYSLILRPKKVNKVKRLLPSVRQETGRRS